MREVKRSGLERSTMEDSKQQQQQKKKNYRKRSVSIEEVQEEDGEQLKEDESDDERERRLALEEIKLLQKQRERKSGIPANPGLLAHSGNGGGLITKFTEKNEGDGGDKDDLVLQDTFAQETAVMVEDPNMYSHFSFPASHI